MALSNLAGWNTSKEFMATAACGSACGAGKPEEAPASACGAAPEEAPASACGAAPEEAPASACGAAPEEKPSSACGA
ncbi:MAG: ACGX-repeat peptide [Lachnospiraceae bacterium]|nr:ACGX-repeat peptide [Lachnospiraceae bacterium]